MIALGWALRNGKIGFFEAVIFVQAGLLPANFCMFWAGRAFGASVFERRPLRWIAPRRAVERVLDRARAHGERLAFFTRFTPTVRAPVYLALGLSGLRPARFLRSDALASLIQVPALILVGFLIAATPAATAAVPSTATAGVPSTAAPAAVAPRFAAGDLAFRERKDPERARAALTSYRADREASPEDPQAAWRLGMACYFVGFRLEKDGGTREKIFAEGRDAALAGVKTDPSCAPCHFWAAINMALYGQEVGVFKMLFSLNEVREHLRATLKLEPGYANAGAYRLLGVIERKLPGILGGNDDRALENFRSAVATSPDEPLNYLFLARELLERGKTPEAVAAAEQGIRVSGLPAERVESIEAQADLRALLATSNAR